MVQERLFDHESFLQTPGADVTLKAISGFGRDVCGNLGHVELARPVVYQTVEKSSIRMTPDRKERFWPRPSAITIPLGEPFETRAVAPGSVQALAL